LVEYLPGYTSGKLELKPQTGEPPSYSKKVSKEDGLIDWNKPAERLEREIRAYAGWPRSRARIKNVDCIILEANIDGASMIPGEIRKEKDSLLIGCGKDSLLIKKLQPAGRKPMSDNEFIRGYIK
jgi:methionyl-tRNA formyltransferase